MGTGRGAVLEVPVCHVPILRLEVVRHDVPVTVQHVEEGEREPLLADVPVILRGPAVHGPVRQRGPVVRREEEDVRLPHAHREGSPNAAKPRDSGRWRNLRAPPREPVDPAAREAGGQDWGPRHMQGTAGTGRSWRVGLRSFAASGSTFLSVARSRSSGSPCLRHQRTMKFSRKVSSETRVSRRTARSVPVRILP